MEVNNVECFKYNPYHFEAFTFVFQSDNGLEKIDFEFEIDHMSIGK